MNGAVWAVCRSTVRDVTISARSDCLREDEHLAAITWRQVGAEGSVCVCVCQTGFGNLSQSQITYISLTYSISLSLSLSLVSLSLVSLSLCL